MELKQKQQEYLTAIFQGVSTAIQSIEDIINSVNNKELKEELKKQQKEYEKVSDKCRQYAEKYSLKIEDNNFFEKAKLWTSIKMTTLANNHTRHIAEMMLIGTNMGIITCYKDKFDYKDVSDELDEIIELLENLEVKNFNELKPYLNIEEQKR